MTLSLSLPLKGLPAATLAALEAAEESMAYWQPKDLPQAAAKAAPEPVAEVAALEQMYSYFG